MAALDRTKEELAYLKLWQGVIVVTDISVIGWIASSKDSVLNVLFLMALAVVALLTVGGFVLHRLIERLIDEAGKL